MSDRPLIMSGPMVKALLDGRKTQTRRIVKGEVLPAADLASEMMEDLELRGWSSFGEVWAHVPYAVGDRLWVREALHAASNDQGAQWAAYRADGRDVYPLLRWPWKRPTLPSIHMPRWASRLTLLVTDVRVERLQDISEKDARAEGVGLYVPGHGFITESELRCDPGYSNFLDPRLGFETIWSEIHGPDAWARNDWVTAITFRTIRANIDAPEAQEQAAA